MNSCAITYSPNCLETTLDGKRGICKNCYKTLVEEGLITVSGEYPDWLEEMVRIQDNYDQYTNRHTEILVFTPLEEKELV
jgi:hypothetical protein